MGSIPASSASVVRNATQFAGVRVRDRPAGPAKHPCGEAGASPRSVAGNGLTRAPDAGQARSDVFALGDEERDALSDLDWAVLL